MSKINHPTATGETFILRTQEECKGGMTLPEGMMVAVIVVHQPTSGGAFHVSITDVQEEASRIVVKYNIATSNVSIDDGATRRSDERLIPFSTKPVVFEDVLAEARLRYQLYGPYAKHMKP